jgi:addiction module HigA family antidote
MEMFNPPHPGESIREDCIKAVGLTITAAAAELGISRQSLSEVLNGHNGVSADMALRLENKGWGSAEGWLRNQASYDLWQARQAAKTKALAAKRAVEKKAAAKPAPPAKKRA